jgi:hypothetical protein
MLLVLVNMKCVLDLVAKALAIGRVGVPTMLLLVDVASTTTLYLSARLFPGGTSFNLLQCGTRLELREC